MWHPRRRVHSINNQHSYQTLLLQSTHPNKIGVLLKVGTLYKGFMQEFSQPCQVLCIFCGKKIFEFGYFIQVFKGAIVGCDVIKSVVLPDTFMTQSITKCISSSWTLQILHSLWHAGILTPPLRCLPFSISKAWELVRILVIAFLYLKFFTNSRYFSMPKVVLIFA